MSSTNTENWIGTKKPKIEMPFRYYFDDEVAQYMKKFDSFYELEADEQTKTLLKEWHTDIKFLKFNHEILYTISHEGEIHVVDEEFNNRLIKEGIVFA